MTASEDAMKRLLTMALLKQVTDAYSGEVEHRFRPNVNS